MSDILYLPAAAAELLTQQLWALSDPNPTRGTTALFDVVGALDESKWLVVDTQATIPVNAAAELNGIGDILQPFIDAGALPANTNQMLADYVIASRGQRIRLWDMIPQFFKDQALTRAQLVEEGKLNAPSTIP